MSAQSKQEFKIERLSRVAEVEEGAERFLEAVSSFRKSVGENSDYSTVYSMRQAVATLQINQWETLIKKHHGDVRAEYRTRFFEGLEITPQLMLKMASLVEEHVKEADTVEQGMHLAKLVLNHLENLDVGINEELPLIELALRRLTGSTFDRGLDHLFAERLLELSVTNANLPAVVVRAYLGMQSRELIQVEVAGDDLTPSHLSPLISAGASEWLRRNEGLFVARLGAGPLNRYFDTELATQAKNQGLSCLSWMIRLRQEGYRPEEILQNAVMHGADPDQRMIDLLEKHESTAGIKASLDLNAALMAYGLARNVPSYVFALEKNALAVFRSAVEALTSLGHHVHEQMVQWVTEKALETISCAPDHNSVKWLAQLECLDGTLKRSRRYQGMRLELDLGM